MVGVVVEWLTFIWSMLDTQSKPIGALSSIVFGLSSAVVAGAALRLNYRNNHGAKPRLHIASLGMSRDPKTGEEFNTFTCEVWNRRKYPIRLKLIAARMPDVDFKELARRYEFFQGAWMMLSDGEFVQRLDVEVDAGKHFAIEGKFPVIKLRSRNWPGLRLSYFDPIAGSPKSVKMGRRQRFRWWRADTVMRVRRLFKGKPREVVPVRILSRTAPAEKTD